MKIIKRTVFIFRDDEEGGDDTYDNIVDAPERQAHHLGDGPQNLALPEDSHAHQQPTISKDQFERLEDPLNSRTTLDFKNVLGKVNGDGENAESKQAQGLEGLQ